jgi:hypothetical protein
MRAYAVGSSLLFRGAVAVLIAAQSSSSAGAQSVDSRVRSALTLYSERMATLATRLDRASALAERASRIADPAAAPSASSSGEIPSDADAARLRAEEVMTGLRERVAQRTEMLQLAATVAGKLNAQKVVVAPAARGNVGRMAEASLEHYIALAGDLAKGDFKADVEAARAALDTLHKAARAAASQSWKNAPRAAATDLLPKRIADDLARGTGFSRMTVEDALFVHLAMASDGARADLQTVLVKATQENDRVYRAAVKADLALGSAIMDLRFAAADRQLRSRRVAAVAGNDLAGMVQTMVGLGGHLIATDAKDELNKLSEQLSDLKKRKKQLINQMLELEQQILQIEADCAAVADRVRTAIEVAKKAAAGAFIGALIGGLVGGPPGAIISGAAAGAAAGASAKDMAVLQECQKKLIALVKELDRLKGELAKIDVAMKQLLNQIETLAKKRNEQEERARTEREAATVTKQPRGAARLKENDANVRRATSQDNAAAKMKKDARAPVVERPCGSPDRPCKPAATSRTTSPGSGSAAMDRLGGGGGMPGAATGGTRSGAAVGTRNPNAAASSSGSSGGAVVPATGVNRNAIGASSPPPGLR